MKGIIYKATNQLNGMVYIGQTTRSLETRKSQHLKDAVSDIGNEFHFHLCGLKQIFEWEVIDEFSGDKEYVIHALNVAEEYHIIKYDSCNPAKGYNSTYGGYSSDKFAEHIRKRLNANMGAKRLLQYDLDGNFIREYESLGQVSSSFGLTKIKLSNIIGHCWHGYQWRIKENERFPRKIQEYTILEKGTRSVVVYDSNGSYLEQFNRLRDASDKYGYHKVRNFNELPIIQKEGYDDCYFFDLTDNTPENIDITVIRKKERVIAEQEVRYYDKYSIDGKFVNRYYSKISASIDCGLSKGSSSIYKSASRPLPYRVSSQTKYIWRISKDDVPSESIPIMRKEPHADRHISKKEHRVIQYSLEGNFISLHSNLRIACMNTGESYSLAYRMINGVELLKTPKFQWISYCEGYPSSIKKYIPRPRKTASCVSSKISRSALQHSLF